MQQKKHKKVIYHEKEAEKEVRELGDSLRSGEVLVS